MSGLSAATSRHAPSSLLTASRLSRTVAPPEDSTYDKGAAQAAALNALSKLHIDGLFTDLTLKCGATELKVHRSILCATSEWFVKICGGGFKVRFPKTKSEDINLTDIPQEAKSKVVLLPDDKEAAVAAMVHFCYHFTYNNSAHENKPMTFHIQIFSMGEKYLIPALSALALFKLEKSAADKFDSGDFTSAVKKTYELDDPKAELKQVIAKVSVEHAVDLFGSAAADDEKTATFRTMAAEIPEYALAVLRETNNVEKDKKDKGYRRYRCILNSGCSGHFVVDRTWAQREFVSTYYYNCQSCTMRYPFKESEEWEKHRAD